MSEFLNSPFTVLIDQVTFSQDPTSPETRVKGLEALQLEIRDQMEYRPYDISLRDDLIFCKSCIPYLEGKNNDTKQ